MTSFRKMLFALLLFTVMGIQAQADTVLYDFQDQVDPFLHAGTITTTGGILSNCGLPGNFCATHTGNFTESPFEPNAFGLLDLGPFVPSQTPQAGLDLSGFIGFKVDARFIRTGISLFPGQTAFSGLSPIKLGVQWDPDDICPTTMNACSDVYDAPVTLTETFQTFIVLFADFVPVGTPLNNAEFKFLMLTGEFDPNAFPSVKTPGTDWSDGVGRLEFDNIIGIAVPEPASGALMILLGASLLAFKGRSRE